MFISFFLVLALTWRDGLFVSEHYHITQISPASGRLQLFDATGSIDVLIPDLPSTWKPNSIYEVNATKTLRES